MSSKTQNTSPTPNQIDKNAWDTDRYYTAKRIVKDYEKTNNDKIILFKSRGETSDEWYKAGGNSALFYKYFVAKRLGRTAHIIPDNEWQYQFKNKIVSIRFLEKLNTDIQCLGYKPYTVLDEGHGIVAFSLKKALTSDEIDALKKQETKSLDAIRTIAVPKTLNPELYNASIQLCRQLPSKIRSMDPVYRELLGNEILKQAEKVLQTYSQLIRKLITAATAKKAIRTSVTIMSTNVLIIAENGYWHDDVANKIGELIAKIEFAANELTKKGKN